MTPQAAMSGKKRAVSPLMGPREENEATTLPESTAATAMPLAVEELTVVLPEPGPVLAAAVHGRMSATVAQASMACWLTSSGLGELEYDMFAAEML